MNSTEQPSGLPYPAQLVKTIEGQIIPRLLIQTVNCRSHVAERWHPAAEDVEEFSRLLLAHGARIALAYVDLWQERGTSLQELYLSLLAPTPGHLAFLRREGQLSLIPFLLARYRLLRVLQRLRRRRSALSTADATPS